ncbi:IS630 family transposase, partial [Micromonospora sp. NPDC001898]
MAQQLGIARHVVRKWRYRFAADRLDVLLDEPWPGRRRT